MRLHISTERYMSLAALLILPLFILYDVASDTWSGPLAGIPTGVWYTAAVADGNKILLIGGTSSIDALTNLIQVYDVESNSWSNYSKTLPFAISGVAAGKLGNDLIVGQRQFVKFF